MKTFAKWGAAIVVLALLIGWTAPGQLARFRHNVEFLPNSVVSFAGTFVVATGELKTGSGVGTVVKLPTNLFLEGTLGNDTGPLSDGVLIGSLTATAALCQQDDGTSFTSFTTECATGTGDIDFFPATAEVDDAFYIGHATLKFASINIDTTSGVQGSTTMTVLWEYPDTASSWATLTNLSSTLARQDLVDFDESVGDHYNNYEPPSDWTLATVNSIAGYWIRVRVTAFTSSGTDAAGDTITLGTTTLGTGINMPSAGSITEVSFTASTISGTTRDSTFLLMNLTQGTHSLATFTKTTTIDNDDITDLTWVAGDALVVLQLREDGSTEHADVGLILWQAL